MPEVVVVGPDVVVVDVVKVVLVIGVVLVVVREVVPEIVLEVVLEIVLEVVLDVVLVEDSKFSWTQKAKPSRSVQEDDAVVIGF